jgi:hypothetical protein
MGVRINAIAKLATIAEEISYASALENCVIEIKKQ